MEQVLRKVLVKEKKDNATYLVEDFFNSKKLILKISGKMRMHYINISIGEIVYMVLPDELSKEGQLIFEKYICLYNESSDLCQQKRKIESREKN